MTSPVRAERSSDCAAARESYAANAVAAATIAAARASGTERKSPDGPVLAGVSIATKRLGLEAEVSMDPEICAAADEQQR